MMGKDDCSNTADVLKLVPVFFFAFLLMSARSHHLFMCSVEKNFQKVKCPTNALNPLTFITV